MTLFISLERPEPSQLVYILGALGFLYILIIRPAYNVFLHPLRKYPGPTLWAATRIPYAFMALSGKSSKILLDLHSQFGEVIRIAPDELSYVRPDAWKEIMGHRKSGMAENGKDPVYFLQNLQSIVGAPRELHQRMRRILSHGFSAKRMLEQQPIICRYFDRFFECMEEKSLHDPPQPIDICTWYNYTTFDIIGDLAFGESFSCLETSTLHPWIALITRFIRQGHLMAVFRRFIWNFDQILMTVAGKTAADARIQYVSLVQERLDKRLSLPTERPDWVDSMTRDGGMTREELEQNAGLLVMAGSETTAAVLAFATYLLARHPHVMAKAQEEVRTQFKNDGDIDVLSAQGLKYLIAVLDETMRLYPPAPTAFPRRTPPEGQVICGQYVPGNASILRRLLSSASYETLC
jgi:cytochrome P450